MLHTYRPSSRLRPFIRNYVYRDATIAAGIVVRPLRARPDPFLAFHLGDRYDVFEYETGATRALPAGFMVGPQTTRLADLRLRGRVRMFVVSFQPAGFCRLFALPTSDLTDRPFCASDVIGGIATHLHQRLLEAATAGDMVRVVDAVLGERVAHARPWQAIDDAAAMMVDAGGCARVSALAAASGLSERQFERKFAERIGLAPKRYARILRFTRAARLKEQRPDLAWSEVSCAAGYFDQTHLAKDFRAFAGDSPSAHMRLISAVRDVFPSSP